jgi:colicin import membrane protein
MAESTKEKPDAPPAAGDSGEVGSLLKDLLQETRKEVVRERDTLAQQLEDKRSKERKVQEQSKARKREELQAQLLEETRRRNAALNRREREDDAERKTEEVLLALEEAATPAAEVADIPVQVGGSPARGPMKLGLAAVLVLGVLAGGFALKADTQSQMTLPDIPHEAQETVNKAVLQWKAEQAEKRVAAEKAARDAAETKALVEERARLDAEKAALAEERARLDAEKSALEEGGEDTAATGGDAPPKKKRRPRRRKSLKLKKGLF